tara:strand:+ start:1087 stop:1518 length:432 start_codon:yes stop_codon:yes gene_type:complete
MITAENVKELAIRFWAIVGSSSDGHEAAGMFLTGGLLLPDGAWVSIAEHQAMHRPLCDESHEWLSLSVTPLCEDPQRVLARGTVRWGATVTRTGHRLMADVGELWVIERDLDDGLRWTHYWSDSLTLLEGSCPLSEAWGDGAA